MSREIARHSKVDGIPTVFRDGTIGWPETVLGPRYGTLPQVKKWQDRGEIVNVGEPQLREHGTKILVSYVRVKPYRSPFRRALPWILPPVLAVAGLLAWFLWWVYQVAVTVVSFGLTGVLGVLAVVGGWALANGGCGKLHIIRCE